MSYLEDARFRAKRRKSSWNLLLIPFVVLSLALLWFGSSQLLGVLHAKIYPGQSFQNSQHGLGVILAAISPFFGVVPLAMVLSNALIWVIPPARRALDKEAQPHPGTSFHQAQRNLLKLALVLVPISALFSITGALLPWLP
jgi:hypothetical protein